MQKLNYSFLLLMVLIPSFCSPLFAIEEKGWTSSYSPHGEDELIEESEFEAKLIKHKKWIDTDCKEGERAVLYGINLRGKSLRKINLQGAYLAGANFQDAILDDAKFQGADLASANFQDAKLNDAKFQGAYLAGANFQDAILNNAKFQGAYMASANLERAHLRDANLEGADLKFANLNETYLYDANLKGVLFDIKPGRLPNIGAIAQAENLSQIKFWLSPHSLFELKAAFKKFGYQEQKKEIVYSIKHSELENVFPHIFRMNEMAWDNLKFNKKIMRAFETTYIHRDFGNKEQIISIGTKIEKLFGLIFFGLTCKWGMAPGRPLFLIFIFICFFTIPYLFALKTRVKNCSKLPVNRIRKDGIWRVWISERARKDLGSKEPELLDYRGFRALKVAFYFSVLSAFNIGWKDLNVGNWIARVQPREYRLQATGWVRSVSGIQSLISVYLLVFAFLSYFGHPFG